jgi:hypothetical protein
MGKDTKLKAVEKPEPVTLPTQIEPAELAYQTAMITRIQREQAEHQALLKCWSEFLTTKYQLGVNDKVTQAGQIVRGADGP